MTWISMDLGRNGGEGMNLGSIKPRGVESGGRRDRVGREERERNQVCVGVGMQCWKERASGRASVGESMYLILLIRDSVSGPSLHCMP